MLLLQALIQNYMTYYIYGALIIGTINAFFCLLAFADPRQDNLTSVEQVWYYAAFVLAYVFWPAKAAQILGAIISGLREWWSHRSSRSKRYY